MTDKTELLACPLCDEILFFDAECGMGEKFFSHPENGCLLKGIVVAAAPVPKWNTRATSALPEEREKLEALREMLAGTPDYDGDDPRSLHYRTRRQALEAAIASPFAPIASVSEERAKLIGRLQAEVFNIEYSQELTVSDRAHACRAMRGAIAALSASIASPPDESAADLIAPKE
jgi:hypothetical protein